MVSRDHFILIFKRLSVGEDSRNSVSQDKTQDRYPGGRTDEMPLCLPVYTQILPTLSHLIF